MNAEILILTLFWGFCCAVIGVAVVEIFGTEDIPKRLYFGKIRELHERGGWWAFFSSPIGGCVVCTSGQLALWSFSIVQTWNMDLSFRPFAFEWSEASAFLHLLAGCAAVLCAFAINKAYQWVSNKM
jgi:hypothetical protein